MQELFMAFQFSSMSKTMVPLRKKKKIIIKVTKDHMIKFESFFFFIYRINAILVYTFNFIEKLT